MATRKTKSKAARSSRASESKVTVDRGESRDSRKSENFLDKIQNDLEKNQSYLNLILGALIVIVLGVLIFNYFNKPSEQPGNVTPQAEQTNTTDDNGDVTKEALPGKYTVKEGDTLFTIAQKYYDDGYKYTEIIKENNLPGETISTGQALNIPKLEDAMAMASAEASASPETSMSPSASPANETSTETAMASPSPEVTEWTSASPSPAASAEFGTGGAENQTVWGETISGDKYTVQAGDWLSKIAGRAYGDIYQFEKIAKANNITDPNSIEVGTVLSIPR